MDYSVVDNPQEEEEDFPGRLLHQVRKQIRNN